MFGSLPKDTLAEVLLYLSEKESFSSLKELGTISHKQLKSALKDLAKFLKKDAIASTPQEELLKLNKGIKKPFQEILDQLPPEERAKLLRGFLN